MAYNLAGIAALVLLLAVGSAYLVDNLNRASRAPLPGLADGGAVELTMGRTDLTIPATWFRSDAIPQSGFTNQVDLQVRLALTQGQPSFPVDVTLLPRSRVRPGSALLDGVYLHQFGDEMLSGVPGLVGKPLLKADGPPGESVWYDALSPDPFVAKCMAPLAEGVAARCLRTVYLGSGLAAVYGFEITALADWRAFDTEMEKWLAQIGAW